MRRRLRAAALLAALLAAPGLAPARGLPDEDLTTATLDADRCDILDPSHCLLPWPSDHFSVEDPSLSPTSRVVDVCGGAPCRVDFE